MGLYHSKRGTYPLQPINFSTGQNTITHVDRESHTCSFASKTFIPIFSREKLLPAWMKYFLPN